MGICVLLNKWEFWLQTLAFQHSFFTPSPSLCDAMDWVGGNQKVPLCLESIHDSTLFHSLFIADVPRIESGSPKLALGKNLVGFKFSANCYSFPKETSIQNNEKRFLSPLKQDCQQSYWHFLWNYEFINPEHKNAFWLKKSSWPYFIFAFW